MSGFNVSGERANRGLSTRTRTVALPLWWHLGSLLMRKMSGGVKGALRHPVPCLAAVTTFASLLLLGPLVFAGLLVGFGTSLAVWRHRDGHGFHERIRLPSVAAWRQMSFYRRQWHAAMVAAGLDLRLPDQHLVPELKRVRATNTGDVLLVSVLVGQLPEDWTERSARLAMSLGAIECRVHIGRKQGELELHLLRDDPLADVIPPDNAHPDRGNVNSLPVATDELGEAFKLRLLGNHVLIAGATGSGKGSVLWSLTFALLPALKSGETQMWVLDPKGGMEFACGAPLFDEYAYGALYADGVDSTDHELEFAEVLESAVSIMRARQAALRGLTRQHKPSPEHPLLVLVIDELAALTAYVTNREAKSRIRGALSLLLSQGRAVGVLVVAALQDPRKEVLPFRDLFPTRIALRLTEPEAVDMTLGEGARRRGAACDRIPEWQPGVGYVVIDGKAEPTRVRFPYVTDDDIRTMAYPDSPGLVLQQSHGDEAA